MTLMLEAVSWRSPEQVSAFLERHGPITTKVGQYLALRRDLLPQEYCDELLRLSDRVTPFAWADARKVLVEELGREPERIFEYIDRAPFASGSLAQVHRAKLADGTVLAVKIQRPGIAEQVERDLARLRRLARLARYSKWNFGVSPTELVDEISEWLRREIDLKREFASARRLWRATADSPIQRVPEVFSSLSAARVITYEFLDGTPVTSVLAGRDRAPAGGRAAPDDEDLKQFAENLVEASLTQLFQYQFFHADLHPGNLLILPGNIVGFVDFGFCDELDESVRTKQVKYLTAVYNDDEPRMFGALKEILAASPDANVEGFRRDFANDRRMLEGRRDSHAEAGRDTGARPAGDYLSTVLGAARRNGYRVPSSILSIYRALLTAETVAARLGVGDAIREVGTDFFHRLQRREFKGSLTSQERKEQFFVSLLDLARDSPKQLNQILTDISDGTLSVKVEVSEEARVTQGRNRRARLSAAAILSVGVAVLLTRPTLPEPMGVPLAPFLVVALIGLYAAAFRYWRRL